MSAPYVPTPREVVLEMLRLADVSCRDIVVDPGAGDCRIVIEAARRFGAYGIAIEKLPHLVLHCIREVHRLNLGDRVLIVWGDIFNFDYSVATVVTLYLGPELNEKLRPKLERELRPGTRVVSHDFEVPGWRPVEVRRVRSWKKEHTLYLYIAGESFNKSK